MEAVRRIASIRSAGRSFKIMPTACAKLPDAETGSTSNGRFGRDGTRLLQFVSQTMKRFGLSADRHGSVHMNVNRWFYGIPIQLAEKF
jgi:hypothetical protein